MLQDKIRQLAIEKQRESLGCRDLVFPASRQIAADTAKDIGAFLRAEATGDFLLKFGHANVVFALIIGERHLGIGEEPEGFGLVVPQPLEQVARFTAFGATSSARC